MHIHVVGSYIILIPSTRPLLRMHKRTHAHSLTRMHAHTHTHTHTHSLSLSLSTGDEITEITVIDDGWMEGRVKRTGQYGMLPSNYVEKR